MWSPPITTPQPYPPTLSAQSNTNVAMADLVHRQVLNFHSFFPGGQIRTLRPNGLFELPLVVGPSRVAITLAIELPEGFPDLPPLIRISPMVAHRWVESATMQVRGHEALQTTQGGSSKWNRNVSLGKVVKDIEIEFNLRPPTVLAVPPGSVMQSVGTSTENFIYSENNRSIMGVSSNIRPQEIQAFPEIDTLGAKGIRRLLDQEAELETWFKATSAVRSAHVVQNELYEANLKLAQENLAATDELERLKGRLEEVQTILELEEAELRQLMDKHRSGLSKFTAEGIRSDFATAVSEAELAASNVLKKFAEDGMSIVDFISAYGAAQYTVHRRAMTFEKLKQHLHSDGTRP